MYESALRILFLLHVASTLFMLGVIWFVQVVHYPLFARTGLREFPEYQLHHTGKTRWVVGPPMLVEGVTGVSLYWFLPAGVSIGEWGVGLGLLVVIWLSTFLIQIPCHTRLGAGFDAMVHHRLVSSNWIRTAAWSLRGLLVLWMAWSVGR